MTDRASDIAFEKIDFVPLCEPVAIKLWGAPSQTTEDELRWGTHGARRLNRHTGQWYDHEAKEGGCTVELLKRERGLSFGDAVEFLRREGFVAREPAQQSRGWPRSRRSSRHTTMRTRAATCFTRSCASSRRRSGSVGRTTAAGGSGTSRA